MWRYQDTLMEKLPCAEQEHRTVFLGAELGPALPRRFRASLNARKRSVPAKVIDLSTAA